MWVSNILSDHGKEMQTMVCTTTKQWFPAFCGHVLEVANDNILKTIPISNIPFLAQKQHTTFRMPVYLKLSNHSDPKMNTAGKQTRL